MAQDTNKNENTVGRRITLNTVHDELLNDLETSTRLPKGVIVGKALELFAASEADTIANLILEQAAKQAEEIRKRFNLEND